MLGRREAVGRADRACEFKDAGFFSLSRKRECQRGGHSCRFRARLLVGWPRWVQEPIAFRAWGASAILDQAIESLGLIFNISTNEVRAQLQAFVHSRLARRFLSVVVRTSYLPVNGLQDQQVLSESLDNKLFFAGEATSVGHIGTVHGAIQSGERAAQEILKIYRDVLYRNSLK